MDNAKKSPSLLRDPDLLIACLALAVLIVITVAGVAARYIVNRPFGWMEEVQLWCLVWTSFLGASAVARYAGHIAIDAFIGIFPKAMQRVAYGICQLVTIAVLGFFGFYAYRLVMQMHNTERATNILEIPYSLIYAAVPVSCLVMVLVALRNLIAPRRELTAVEAAIEEVENV